MESLVRSFILPRPTWETRNSYVAKELAFFKPEYFSVTFGAGGSTQEGTFNTCLALQNETSVEPCAHMSGVTLTKLFLIPIKNKN